jgi:hypothetical protein
MGLSLRSVQNTWRAHQLQPHRLRTFRRSRDMAFATKLADVVGLYIDPPAHAVVLSIDEYSQNQALDRTQPGLPIKGPPRSRRTPAAPGTQAAHDRTGRAGCRRHRRR